MILKLALGGVLALLIGFPYLFSASHYLAGKKISLTHSLNNIKNLLIFYWFSLPFYIYGMIILFKRRRLDLGFLSLSSVFIILAYSFLEIGYRTHYKLLHFLAIPYGIILLLLIEEIIKGLDKKIFAYSLISLVIMFSVSAPMAASYIYLNKDWASNKEYISKGINVELRSGASDLAKTYRWIRSNTNERSVLIAPGRIYYETILELLSQRRAYVADGGEYTAENKHFYKRKDEIKKLFTPQRMKIDVLKELQSIRDDAYIVLSKEDNPAYFNLLRNEFLQLNKYLKSVFRTPTIEIYKVIKPID